MENFSWKECYDENGVRHAIPQEPPAQASEFRRVNSWWSDRYQVTVIVFQDKQGRAWFSLDKMDRLSFALQTLEAASAWPVATPAAAEAVVLTSGMGDQP